VRSVSVDECCVISQTFSVYSVACLISSEHAFTAPFAIRLTFVPIANRLASQEILIRTTVGIHRPTS
jgi:hypothetical protein